MATGFPAATGDVLSAAMYNGLTSFTVGTANTADYTAVSADQFQVLEIMNKATAIAFQIPTNASVAFPIGTALTVLNIGVGVCTISAVTTARGLCFFNVCRPAIGFFLPEISVRTGWV